MFFTRFKILLLAILVLPGFILATTTGPNSPGTEADAGGGGGGVPTWTTGSAGSQNDTYSNINNQNKNKNTRILQLTNFGFALTATDNIDGIVVEIDRYATGPANSSDVTIQLIVAGSQAGDNKSLRVFW